MDSSSMYRRAGAASSSAAGSRGPASLAGDKNGVDSSRGDLATAIPHHRPLFRFTLALRLLSFLTGIAMFITVGGLLPIVSYDSDSVFGVLALGFPLGVVAFAWSSFDLAMILLRTEYTRGWPGHRKPQRGLGSNFRWGAPAIHVTAHLVIWTAGIILSALFWSGYMSQVYVKAQESLPMDPAQQNQTETLPGEPLTGDLVADPTANQTSTPGLDKFGFPIATNEVINKMWIMPFLQTILVLIHFSLFVLAAVATDDRVRRGTDVIYLPRDQVKSTTVIPLPSTLWDVFFPKELPLAVSMGQYVRYVALEQQSLLVSRYNEKPAVPETVVFR
ncbi:hypothetical protein F5X68DRAFT_258489 [Plectosphaerella plurivora]|uniref:Uncharacterized protein n=1 Tax=Plectosphaerella plurivora TaxID=936078 RepID=A0A9P8VKQ8_9PEZI|nr:hypothetical protein F5X68DRAFT_258489 [Plectosphaerella plurivora]